MVISIVPQENCWGEGEIHELSILDVLFLSAPKAVLNHESPAIRKLAKKP